MGWDDNGLPTERRVQNHFGVRCDPSVAYDPDFEPPEKPSERSRWRSRGRTSSSSACALTESDEQAFEELWRTARAVGRLVDDLHDDRQRSPSASPSGRSWGCWSAGEAYQLEAPTLWDVDFQTAVAQAELEDRERPGAMHRVRFRRCDATAADAATGDALIETTRPELIAGLRRAARTSRGRAPARARRAARCCTPLFGTRVPVLTHPLVEPREGHGPRDGLHLRRPDRRDVVARAAAAGPLDPGPRRSFGARCRGGAPGWEYGRPRAARARTTTSCAGRTINQARKRIVELLRAVGRSGRRADSRSRVP